MFRLELQWQDAGEILAVDDDQLVRRGREGLVAVLGDHAVVLQAHTAHAGQVDAGLDRDNRALLHDVALAAEDRQLVDVDTHAMTEAVAVVLAVAGITDDLLRQQMDVAAVDAAWMAATHSSCVRRTMS